MRIRRVGFRMTLCTILVAVLGQQEKTYAQLIGNIPVSRPTSSMQQRPANSVTPNVGTGFVWIS